MTVEEQNVPDVSGFGGARPSFMNSILNPMLNTAIDNLSDSDSDLDDYTMDKGYERAIHMLKPKERLIKPHTETELAELIQFRDITKWIIMQMPARITRPLKRARTMWSAVVMRARGGELFKKLTAAFNIFIGIISLLFHCIYLISFTWQFILTSMHSFVLYSDNFWTWLLNDRKTQKEEFTEYHDQDRSSFSNWRDSYDVRETEYVVGEGDKVQGQTYNPASIVPGNGPVNGASALQIVRSQISSMSTNKEKTEPAKPAAPKKAPMFNMKVESDSSEAPAKAPTPKQKTSSSSIESLDSFHPTQFSSSSSSNVTKEA